MNPLLRELAPISDDAWSEIDRRGRRARSPTTSPPASSSTSSARSARRLVGRVRAPRVAAPRWPATSPRPGVGSSRSSSCAARSRSTAPSSRPSTAAPPDADLDPVIDAVPRRWPAPRTSWCSTATPRRRSRASAPPRRTSPITLSDQFDRYPNHVAQAVAVLKGAGVAGPYAIALGPRCYAGVIETTEKGGYPLLQHLGLILGGPVVWAPAVDGAIVLSQRGDDFQLTLGQDTADRLPQPRRRHRHARAPGEPHLRARLARGRHRPHLRLTRAEPSRRIPSAERLRDAAPTANPLHAGGTPLQGLSHPAGLCRLPGQSALHARPPRDPLGWLDGRWRRMSEATSTCCSPRERSPPSRAAGSPLVSRTVVPSSTVARPDRGHDLRLR